MSTDTETKTEPHTPEAVKTETEPTVKMVPESTLATIRKKYSDENKKLRESLDSEIQKGLDLQSQVESFGEVKSKFDKLQSEHKDLSERFYIGELHRQHLLKEGDDSLRRSICDRAGIKPEVLKEKSHIELVALDDSLTILGKPKSSDYATNIQRGGGATQTKNEVLQSMLEEAKQSTRK